MHPAAVDPAVRVAMVDPHVPASALVVDELGIVFGRGPGNHAFQLHRAHPPGHRCHLPIEPVHSGIVESVARHHQLTCPDRRHPALLHQTPGPRHPVPQLQCLEDQPLARPGRPTDPGSKLGHRRFGDIRDPARHRHSLAVPPVGRRVMVVGWVHIRPAGRNLQQIRLGPGLREGTVPGRVQHPDRIQIHHGSGRVGSRGHSGGRCGRGWGGGHGRDSSLWPAAVVISVVGWGSGAV